MKYVATLNGKRYEVEIEKIEEFQPIPRGVENRTAAAQPVAAPVQQAAPVAAPAPVQQAAPVAAPAPAPAPAPVQQSAPAQAAGSGTAVPSPLVGIVLDIMVNVGDTVTAGQPIVNMEAMKMENEVPAPIAGTITAISVKKGENVEAGTTLVTIG